MIRNLRCTVTIDSVLANSKTQNAFFFTVNAIFLHDYPLAVEPGSTPRPLVQKEFGEILYLLICSFLPCLSWLLRSRVRKYRRDLWITLYIYPIFTVVFWKVKSEPFLADLQHRKLPSYPLPKQLYGTINLPDTKYKVSSACDRRHVLNNTGLDIAPSVYRLEIKWKWRE